MSRAEYMRLRRKKITVISNGKMLQCNAADLLQCNAKVLQCNAADIEKLLQCNDLMLQCNAQVTKRPLQCNTAPLQCNAKVLQCNAQAEGKTLQCNAPENSKNGEICSKTPFLAVSSSQNSAQNGEGGFGGLGCTRPGVAISTDNEMHNVHNKEKEISKNKNPKNQKQEFSPKEKRAYIENLKRAAFPYWAVMPEECRKKSTFKKFFEVFNRIKSCVPEIHVFYGCLRNAMSGWNEGFYKAADTFLSGEPWIGLSAKEKQDIERHKADFDRMAKACICKFNGEKK